jgi:hypothetical protein
MGQCDAVNSFLNDNLDTDILVALAQKVIRHLIKMLGRKQLGWQKSGVQVARQMKIGRGRVDFVQETLHQLAMCVDASVSNTVPSKDSVKGGVDRRIVDLGKLDHPLGVLGRKSYLSDALAKWLGSREEDF